MSGRSEYVSGLSYDADSGRIIIHAADGRNTMWEEPSLSTRQAIIERLHIMMVSEFKARGNNSEGRIN